MVTLQQVIEFMHRTAEPLVDYTVRSHRGVEEIIQWNETKLGPQPTTEQLATVAASAEFLSWRADLAKARRRQRLRDMILKAEDNDLMLLLLSLMEEIVASLSEVRTRQGLPNRSWPALIQSVIDRSNAKINAVADSTPDNRVNVK